MNLVLMKCQETGKMCLLYRKPPFNNFLGKLHFFLAILAMNDRLRAELKFRENTVVGLFGNHH